MNRENDLYTGAGASGCFPPDPPLQGGSDLAAQPATGGGDGQAEPRLSIRWGHSLHRVDMIVGKVTVGGLSKNPPFPGVNGPWWAWIGQGYPHPFEGWFDSEAEAKAALERALPGLLFPTDTVADNVAYCRPECLFKYCPDPEGCRAVNECASPAIPDHQAMQMASQAIHHNPHDDDDDDDDAAEAIAAIAKVARQVRDLDQLPDGSGIEVVLSVRTMKKIRDAAPHELKKGDRLPLVMLITEAGLDAAFERLTRHDGTGWSRHDLREAIVLAVTTGELPNSPKEGDRSVWLDDASGETGPAEFHRGEWRER